jgi:hypothetical protein
VIARAGLLLAALAGPAAAQADPPRTGEYRQSPAVLARYGDVPVALAAPGLAPGRTAPTSQAEMTAFLADLKARRPGIVLESLGRSIEDRDIPVLVFGDATADRPVVWLVGGQHGNEPAGAEAMLALAHALAEGELGPLLDRVTVVIVPRANPDGAASDMRVAANGLDPNRDHLLLSLPEIRALHARMAALPPDIVVDHHEFQVAGAWLRAFGALQGSDAMLLAATHPGTPKAIAALAEEAVLPAMEAGLAREGLSSFVYHVATGRAGDRTVSLGGNAPGISRNAFGLTGALSFLVETRGIGIGLQGYQRRVATHYLAARAVLELAAARGPEIRATVAAARRGLAEGRDPIVVGQAVATVPATLPLVDPATGADRPTPVALQDSRRVTVTATRPRPAGYLLQPAAAPALEALRLRGAATCVVAPGTPIAVEAFRIAGAPGPVNRESIQPERAAGVVLEPRTVRAQEGAAYVPAAQPLAAIVAAALEPDSPGSPVGVGLVPVDAGGEAPIYRVPERPAGLGAGCGP